MTVIESLGLGLAAVAGGAMNAIAGGGTLVTFPTLLLFGTPAVTANATSTLALVIGTSGGIYGYRKHLAPIRTWLWCFLPVSLLGGLTGGILLTCTGDRTFAQLVPFLILFASIVFLTQSVFRRFGVASDSPAATRRGPPLWGPMLCQFLVAVYGGYFGAGIGILMLATLGFLGLSHIHEMNALKTALGSAINLVAAAWFVSAGLIDWPRALVMTLGALAGYYLGSRFSQQIPQARVRQIIVGIGLALSAVTFCQQFLQ